MGFTKFQAAYPQPPHYSPPQQGVVDIMRNPLTNIGKNKGGLVKVPIKSRSVDMISKL